MDLESLRNLKPLELDQRTITSQEFVYLRELPNLESLKHSRLDPELLSH